MFGQSVFESVLDRLKAEARESARHDGDPETDDGATGVRGLPTGFAGLGTGHAFASGSQAEAAYLDLTDKVVKSKSWKDLLKKNGWNDEYLAGDEFKKYIEEETKRVTEVLTQLGLVK